MTRIISFEKFGYIKPYFKVILQGLKDLIGINNFNKYLQSFENLTG